MLVFGCVTDTNLRAPSLQARARRRQSVFSSTTTTDMYLRTDRTQTQEVRLDARMKEQSKEDKELEKVHLFMGDWMT